MAGPSRYSPEMLAEYRRHWNAPTFSGYWDLNAQIYPEQEALVDARVRLTWSQLKQMMDRLALGLLEMGMERDQVLVLQLPNWVELYLMRMACEKAGIMSLPALRTFRHHEMEYMCRHVEAAGVVIPWEFGGRDYYQMVRDIQPGLPSLKHILVVGNRVPPGTISVWDMMERPLEQQFPPDHLESRRYRPDDIILTTTSGSTGLPKVVEQPMGARLMYIRITNETLGMSSGDTVASFSPVASGPNSLVFIRCPVAGAKGVLLETFSAEEALELVQRERVTVMGLVPAMLVMLVEHPNFSRYDLSSLRVIFCAAAPFPYEQMLEVQKRMPCPIVYGYGALDLGGGIMSSPQDPDAVRLGTVGKPHPAFTFKIVDEGGREVPSGEAGELLGSGPGCASGYYRDPETTGAAWSTEGWFRTGDLARWDDQGHLMIVGRKKEMIIRGGQNIYPIELENLLAAHPKVARVAVVGMPDPVLGERACAFIVPRGSQVFDFEEMVAYLRGQDLASFKLPERLEIRESLPHLSEVNKVDKRSLRQEIAQMLEDEAHSRPRSRGSSRK